MFYAFSLELRYPIFVAESRDFEPVRRAAEDFRDARRERERKVTVPVVAIFQGSTLDDASNECINQHYPKLV